MHCQFSWPQLNWVLHQLSEYIRGGQKIKQPSFNCNICFNFIHRTSRSCLNHSQEPCEWIAADLRVLLVESEQKLHLKVGHSNFSPVQDFSHLPTYLAKYLSNNFFVTNLFIGISLSANLCVLICSFCISSSAKYHLQNIILHIFHIFSQFLDGCKVTFAVNVPLNPGKEEFLVGTYL